MTIAEIISDTHFLVKTDTTSYPSTDMLRNINAWYNTISGWIWQSTGTWEYDDNAHLTLPIAFSNLVHNQQDYELPVVAQKVMGVDVLDGQGNWHKLEPIDKSQLDISMSEHRETAGMPIEYDLVGRSIILYPKPSQDAVTLIDGLKVYISREIIPFLATDTTREPGFNEAFHRILSLGAALDYCIANELGTKELDIRRQLFGGETTAGLKNELQKFYSARHREEKISIIPEIQNYS